ncbi:MAG: VOC family protein [Vitreoscilla sp.]|nr:VOC family protein [Vitreoscilla sp.]
MSLCQLDHLTLVAPDLAGGADAVSRWLGVPLQPGGEHPRMGTHNRLLRLGEGRFLEVIAPNPAAPAPARPRWFGLDRLAASVPPRLATWVARTSDLRALADEIRPVLGEVETMTRGDLRWLITLTPDGGLPLGGLAPALIEWPVGVHPASRLPDQGCALVRLTAHSADAPRLQHWFERLGLADDISVVALPEGVPPYLEADIQTPSGLCRLGGPGN